MSKVKGEGEVVGYLEEEVSSVLPSAHPSEMVHRD